MEMHFNYKDLFKAPRIAFSFQRIWMNGIGLIAGYVIYLIFTYISLMISGFPFPSLWANYGLLPCAFAVGNVPWFGMLIYILGLIAFFAVILLTNTAVSRVVYMVLRDELFYTWTQAYRFAFKKWVSVLGALLTFIFMIAFFVIGALVMGLLGRIPFLGELGTSLLTVPYILAALLLLFISIVFGVGLFFVPAIIATSDEDALGGVFQSFSITYNQPFRLVVYSIVSGFLYLVSGFLFAAVMKSAYRLFDWLFGIGMGEKFTNITEKGLHEVNQALPAVSNYLQTIGGQFASWVYFGRPHMAPELPAVQDVSAYIFAFFVLLLAAFVVAYAEAVGNSALTIMYVILYKLHEKENLLEREDEELKEEEEEESPEGGETKAETSGGEAPGPQQGAEEPNPES